MQTVFGPIADKLGHAVTSEPVQGPYGVWLRREHFAAPSTQYRRSQSHVDILVNHEGDRIGELADLVLQGDKELIGVAVVDTDANLGDGSWHFSPAVRFGHRTGVLDLLELSVTQQPASVALRSIRALPGDVRHATARRRWDVPSSLLRMFEDAADAATSGRPIIVRTPQPAVRSTTAASSYSPAPAERISEPDYDRRDVVGPIRHWPAMKDSVIAVY